MIPKNINREHVIKAIEESKKVEIPKNRSSKNFLLEFNGDYYPPKYIISLANKYANGKELNPQEFGGGVETNDFLRDLRFNIVKASTKSPITKSLKENKKIKVSIAHLDSDPFLARIIIADEGEWKGDPNDAKRLLEHICKKWPEGKKVKFVITCGGFIQFKWPQSISRKNIGDSKEPNKNPDKKALDALVKEAKNTAEEVLSDLKGKLREFTDYITLGIDSCQNDQSSPFQVGDLNIANFKKEYKKQYVLIDEVLKKHGVNSILNITPEQLKDAFNELINIPNFQELIEGSKTSTESKTDEFIAKNRQKLAEIYPRTLNKSLYIQLVFLVDLKRNQFYWTGKSYPMSGPEEKRLIRISDLTTHFYEVDVGKVMILGCHDLNVFSPRGKATTKKEWRKQVRDDFDKNIRTEKPKIVLQHPHIFTTPRTWTAAWNELLTTDDSIKYSSAGRFNEQNSKPDVLCNVLKKTNNCDTIDFVVHLNKEEK